MEDLQLPGKKYLMLLRTLCDEKTGYPENFQVRVAYSYLVWVAQWKRPVKKSDVVDFLALDDDAISVALDRLKSLELATQIDGLWLALEPQDDKRHWFAWTTRKKRAVVFTIEVLSSLHAEQG